MAVKTLSPPGAIKPTGTWSFATRAADFIRSDRRPGKE